MTFQNAVKRALVLVVGTGMAAAALHAQTIVASTEDSFGSPDPYSGQARRFVIANIVLGTTINGSTVAAGGNVSVARGRDANTGAPVFYIDSVWINGEMHAARSDAGVLLDKARVPLTPEAQQAAFEKMTKRGIIALPKNSVLSFAHVRLVQPAATASAPSPEPGPSSSAPASLPAGAGGAVGRVAGAGGPTVGADAGPPRTVPEDAQDPTGFDVLGVKLYMSAEEAIAAIKAKVNFQMPKKPTGAKDASGYTLCSSAKEKDCSYRLCSDDSNPSKGCFAIENHLGDGAPVAGFSDTVLLPAGGYAGYGYPYISSVDYADQSSRIHIVFVGETLSRTFGKPEIATKIIYIAPYPKTDADKPLLLEALHQKYGQPRLTVGDYESNISRDHGWPFPSPTRHGIKEVWDASSGEQATTMSSLNWALDSRIDYDFRLDTVFYPLLTTERFEVPKSYPRVFTLAASPRFQQQHDREMDEKKGQILKDANQQKTNKPIL